MCRFGEKVVLQCNTFIAKKLVEMDDKGKLLLEKENFEN